MTVYGHIVAILNQDQILIQMTEDGNMVAAAGAKWTVFEALKLEKLRALGIKQVVVPKGAIELVMRQSDEIYLAQTFTEGGELVDSAMSHFAGIFNSKVRVGAHASATIDNVESLGIKFDEVTRIGDPVGKL